MSMYDPDAPEIEPQVDDVAEMAPEQADERRDRRRIVPWIVLLVVLAIIWCLLWRFLDVRAPDQPDTEPGNGAVATVTVPDVVGLTADEAVAELEAAGFTVERQVSYDTLADPGTVSSQDPAPGTEAATGSTVFIGVVEETRPGSLLGEDDGLIEVPGVVRFTREDAERRIDREGLTARVTTSYSDSVPAGLVISQSPLAGARVPEGSAVDIVVSLGRRATPSATVPDVMGLTRTQAEARIRAAGLDPRPMWQPNARSVGRVYEQSPEAGEKLPEGGLVFFLMGVRP